MKIKKVIAGLCIGLILNISIPKAVKAEPVSLFWGSVKILGLIMAGTGLWVAMERASLAENDSATESLTKHLEDNPEFPVSGYCESPSIKNGTVNEGWIVSVDDKKTIHQLVKSGFCEAGGVSKNGKYIIGVFTSEYHATNFAKLVKYRTDNLFEVYVSSKSVAF